MTASPGPVPQADVRARVAASFARQAAMATLGVRLGRIEAGEVELLMAHRADLTQQHGFIDAGIVAAALAALRYQTWRVERQG